MPFGEFKVQFLFCLGLLFEDTFSTTGPRSPRSLSLDKGAT